MARTIGLTLLIVATLGGEARAEVPQLLVDELGAVVDEALASEEGETRAWGVRARTLQGWRAARETLEANRDNADLLVRIFTGLGLIELDQRGGAEALAAEIVNAGGASRQRILERYVRHLGESAQVDVLGRVLDGLTDEAGLRDVLGYLARHGQGGAFDLFGRAAGAGEASREVYLEVLIRSGRPEAVGVARELAGSGDASVRLAAIRLAQATGSEAAREVLEGLLGDADAAVSAAAAFALAPLGVPASYERLLAVARDGQAAERARALEAIRDGQPALLALDDLLGMVEGAGDDLLRQRLYEAIGATGSSEAFTLLRRMLQSDVYQDRYFGAAGLGYTGQEEAVPLLAEVVLGGGRAELRELAAEALGHLGLQAAAAPLLQALDRERGGAVELAAIRALATTGGEDSLWPLAFQLNGPDDEAVMAALETLGALDATAVAAQVETVATSHRSAAVRWRATLVLFALDPAVGEIRLQQALDRPPEGFIADLDALPEGPRIEAYRRLVRHSNPDYRALAASRILRQPGGGVEILRELTDPAAPNDMRQLAVAELTANRDRADLALFTELAESSSRVLRAQALEALVELATPESEVLLRELLDAPDLTRRAMAVYGLWRLGPTE